MKQLSLLIVVALMALLGPNVIQSHPNPKSTRGQELIGPIEWECEWDGVFSYSEDCSQYIECWNDVAYLWQCTDLMLFDLTYHGCNFAQYTHCEDRHRPTNVPSTLNPTSPSTIGTTSNVSTSTTEGPSEEFDCPEDGVFAHETRCEYYWNCYAGVAQLVHCQTDFLFDLVYMGCNFPEYTHCQDRTRPPGVKPTLLPSQGTTTPRASTTTTQVPSTTVGVTGTTPEVEPTDVFTGSTVTRITITTPTTTTTTERPGGEFRCPIGVEGDFPDPEDCGAFYTCVGGVAFHQYCPAGLHFNPAIDACDYPANVDCEIGKLRRNQ